MFKHTRLENGLWRGWFRNGQALEISWHRKWSHSWPGVACQVLIHANDCDNGDRMLNLALGPVQAFIPLGISKGPYTVGDEPGWGFSICREFGLILSWGHRRKAFDWAFRWEVVSREYEAADGAWRDNRKEWDWREKAKLEAHPYTYTLENGTVQSVTAEIRQERTVRGRRYLRRLGWPTLKTRSIDVHFSGEVGERAGSWKGGCIGCGYTMRDGETPFDTLRRMERERKF